MTAQTILPANTLSSGAYDVANSLRFRGTDGTYMHKTPGSAGNRRTFTFSTWVKRSNFGDKIIFAAGGDSNVNGYVAMYFSGEALRVRIYEGSAKDVVTSMLFRDSAAWYHIVVAVDTTQGTAANRVKIYVNGSEATKASGSYASQNFDTSVNNDSIQQVGIGRDSSANLSNALDGYLAETVLIDGSALDATSFGEFDSDSAIWKPIDVSGLTFGTNGFYLDYEASGNLGNDANGGTDLTEVNVAATDQSTDTCTNNFATLNNLYLSAASNNFVQGNLTNNGNSSNAWRSSYMTIGISAGKWYFEFRVNKIKSNDLGNMIVGIVSEDQVVNTANNGKFFGTSRGYGYHGKDGKKLNNDTVTDNGASYGSAFTTVGDIVGCAIDLDNHKIYFSKNGTFQASGDPTTGSTGTGSAFDLATGYTYLIAVASYYDDERYSFNFGSPPHSISSGNADGNGHGNFEYAVPSGYLALNSKNLAESGG